MCSSGIVYYWCCVLKWYCVLLLLVFGVWCCSVDVDIGFVAFIGVMLVDVGVVVLVLWLLLVVMVLML